MSTWIRKFEYFKEPELKSQFQNFLLKDHWQVLNSAFNYSSELRDRIEFISK